MTAVKYFNVIRLNCIFILVMIFVFQYLRYSFKMAKAHLKPQVSSLSSTSIPEDPPGCLKRRFDT